MKKRISIKLVFKILLAALMVIIIFLIGLLVYLTINEYRPKATEQLAVSGTGQSVDLSQEISVVTYNIGYGALSKEEDFFMDGGKKVRPSSSSLIENNMKGIAHIIKTLDADVTLVQEVDLDSKRSYHMDQRTYLQNELGTEGIFAYNFNTQYVPYPLPTIGKVESGLLTLTDLNAASASRISLPVPFSWPVSTCNLKRCLLETRIPIEGTDKELVIFNLHLEAYDDGEGKIAQTNLLMSLLDEEYQNGNYVIAGGDFNQTFDTIEGYPIFNEEDWVPGTLSANNLPAGFSFAVDDSHPTCRLLNAAYTGNYEESQVYVIDGFIVSENVKVETIEVIDTQFEYSDHQPVKLTFTLAADESE